MALTRLESKTLQIPNRFPQRSKYFCLYPFVSAARRSIDVTGRSVGISCRTARSSKHVHESEADAKLVHWWKLDDVNGAVEDVIGAAVGDNNGVASTTGDWVGNAAGAGNESIASADVGSYN